MAESFFAKVLTLVKSSFTISPSGKGKNGDNKQKIHINYNLKQTRPNKQKKAQMRRKETEQSCIYQYIGVTLTVAERVCT